jgi:hypothetical protein
MSAPYVMRYSHFCRLGVYFLALFLSAALTARAGLTMQLHIYNGPGPYYVFYTPVLTDASSPAAALGTYIIQSPQWPTNGSQHGFDLTTNGPVDRYEFDSENFYGSLGSAIFGITNGTWSIIYTNATTTNQFNFQMGAGVADSNTLPLTTISFPVDGSLIFNSQTNFTWQGPATWGVPVNVSLHNNDYTYYQSATIPTGQSNWIADSSIPTGTNYTFNVDYLLTNSFFTSTTPLNTNNSQPIAGWTLESLFEAGASAGFNVGAVPTSASQGHTCLGYYTFEDNNLFAYDFSGNGNNLSYAWFGSPPYIATNDAVAGMYAGGFGGSGWFTGPDTMSNLFSASFSVSLWLKTTNIVGSDNGDENSSAGIVSALGNDYNNDVMPMGLAGSKLAFYTGGSVQNTLRSHASINTGQYVHVVTTRDQQTGEKRIYVNGVLDSSIFSDTDLLGLENTSGPAIGYNNGNVFSGEMDEIQFYSGVLSSNEVAFLYSHPGSNVADTLELSVPVGRYDFEDTNSPGTDTSGRHNDANCNSASGPNVDVASTNAAVGNYARQFFGDTSICFSPNSQGYSNLSNALSGSFSVTAWVNTTNSVNSDYANAFFGLPILFVYDSNTNGAVPMSITGSKAAFTISNPNGLDTTIHSTTSVNDGNYHLIAVTRCLTNGLMSLYVDGNLEATGTCSTTAMIVPTITLAGGYYANYQGLLDDVRIYGGVLSPDDVAGLAASSTPTFASALNTSGLAWTTSGDSNWFVETTNTYNGSAAAAQSGSVTNSESSILSVTVTGPGTLTFAWSCVANDPNGGFDFEFDIDGADTDDINRVTPWEVDPQTGPPYAISAGQHTLTWTVFPNGDTDPTEAGYLDDVVFVQGILPVITVNPFSQTNYPGYEAALFAAASTNTPAVTWQWFKAGNASPIPSATNGLYIPTNSGTAGVAGGYYAVASNSSGSAVTLTAAVTFASAPLPPDWSAAFTARLYNNTTDNTSNYNIACVLDSTGNLYTVGQINGTNTFGTNLLISINQRYGASILKQTTNGTAIWGACITNNGNGSSYSECAAIAPGDGVYAAGDFFGTNWLGTNQLVDTVGGSIFLARFDNAGNLLWLRTVTGTSSGFTEYHQLISDPAGNVTLSGLVSGNVSLGTTNVVVTGQKGILAQWDASGNVRWVQQPSGWPDYLVYQGGRIYGTMGGSPTNSIGGISNVSDRRRALFSLNATNGQGYWIQGIAGGQNSGSPAGLVDDDPVVAAFGTNIFVAGSAWTNATFGPYSVSFPNGKGQYFARYDTNGNAQLATSFGSQFTWPWAMSVDASGNVYIGGDFDTYSIFGSDIIAAPFHDTVQYYGTIDDRIPGQGFVAKFDRNGNPLWARLAESQSSFLNCRDIAAVSDGVWVCGFFNQFATFGQFTINGSITVFGFPFGTITYHPAPYLAKVTQVTALPVTLLNSQAGGGTFQLSFLSQSGATHDVQYRTNLVSGLDWQTYTNVAGDGTSKTVSIPLSVFSPSQQGYLRVLTQ